MAGRHDKRATMFRTVIIFVIVFIVGGFALVRLSERNGTADLRGTLAQCLTEKGTVMYGAYWCPNCANQKKDFGSAWKQVTYVECAVPGNPRAQTKECEEKGITGYPTWEFSSGERLVGRQDLSAIAEAAGCPWGSSDVSGAASPSISAPETGDEAIVEGAGASDDGAMMEDAGPVDSEVAP